MKKLFTLWRYFFISLFLISFTGCEDDDEVSLPEVVAGFTYTQNEDTGTVTFINISERANTYNWDFGDGTTSTEINPVKTFANGAYIVTLEAFNPAGASATFQDTIAIDVLFPATLPITFDDPNTSYDVTTFNGAAFEVVDNPDVSGTNDKASKVGQITNIGAAFEGFFIELGEAIDLSAQKSIKMNFWSEAGVDVLMKLEQGTAGDVETTATHTGSGWEELVFSFDSAAAYSTLTIFVDGPGTTAGTFYIDDIEQTDTPEPPFDSGLLTNGDFEAGVDPWFGNAANVVTEGGNSFNLAEVQTAGNPFDVNLSQVVAINQGTNYILTFEASSDRERTILAGIGLNEDPFTNTVVEITLTPEIQTYTLQLAANDFGGANSRVLFDMGADVGVVVIDKVSLVEGGDGSDTNSPPPPAAENLLTNGDFEAGVDPWFGNAANVVTEGGNSFNIANVGVAGNPFDVNLSQVVAINQGSTYTLSFDASSDRSRTLIAGIGLNEDPFTNTSQEVNLTTNTQTFTLELTAADFGGSNSRVLFDMGADVGVVVIDNVVLTETSGGGNGGGAGAESPFCRTQIAAFGGDTGSEILLSVFNVDAQTMRIEIESADDDPVDNLVFPAGLWVPIPGISIAPAEISPGVWAGEFFFPDGAPENVEFVVEWSKASFGGNWSSNAPGELNTVPFNATCDPSGN
ncbi:carbohydrate binding domain-containing protein [Robertkochia sp. 1368]|nr:carbohydrate binding domain-containing protein [Robertkochia sediminum]